jgi:hypothetical protein
LKPIETQFSVGNSINSTLQNGFQKFPENVFHPSTEDVIDFDVFHFVFLWYYCRLVGRQIFKTGGKNLST